MRLLRGPGPWRDTQGREGPVPPGLVTAPSVPRGMAHVVLPQSLGPERAAARGGRGPRVKSREPGLSPEGQTGGRVVQVCCAWGAAWDRAGLGRGGPGWRGTEIQPRGKRCCRSSWEFRMAAVTQRDEIVLGPPAGDRRPSAVRFLRPREPGAAEVAGRLPATSTQMPGRRRARASPAEPRTGPPAGSVRLLGRGEAGSGREDGAVPHGTRVRAGPAVLAGGSVRVQSGTVPGPGVGPRLGSELAGAQARDPRRERLQPGGRPGRRSLRCTALRAPVTGGGGVLGAALWPRGAG